MLKNIYCADKELDLTHPQVMGILNVTPDSFADGGQYNTQNKAFLHAQLMVQQGASIIDVGGESTRPGAKSVSVQQELDRVIPIIEKIRQQLDVIISIDSSKATVMREAKNAGAGLINDVTALQGEGALVMAAKLGLPVCLMHMQGSPRSMQHAPDYTNVVDDVYDFFKNRINLCLQHGISKGNLIIDPGFGFGKTVQHNLQLLKNLSHFLSLELPLLIGLSRKSLLQHLTDCSVENRLAGSLSLAVIACMNGGTIFRVHDVKETIEALKVVQAVRTCC
ncbi:MAG: dihydropteroate synthase [Pseudomonadota bacterium]